ncbi:MAG: hypothetical protein ACI9GM_001401 [Salibacteraceae bacterium]|jgi:hypothetical protein
MKITKWLSFLCIVGIIASCYPEKDRTIADLDVVGTVFGENIDFQAYKTYILNDSVEILYDSSEGKPDYPVETSNLILSTMNSNLMNMGWIEANPGDTPDVYIEAVSWNSKVVGVSYYPSWGYWGYPSWGYPGWGYPGYGTSYYSYTTGTLMMYITDVKNYPMDDSAPVIMWTGGLNGILSSGSSASRITRDINQAFGQSPYLNLN